MLQSPSFDVIITTYKRHESLKVLIEQIKDLKPSVNEIIVVDSSPDEDLLIQETSKVNYIRSSHGNQPYQRYLGYLKAKSDIVIYFDDDMRVLSERAFQIIIEEFLNSNTVGVQPNFINKNEFLDDAVPKSKFNFLKKYKSVFSLLKCMTGYCLPKEGDLGYCGIRGPKPSNLGNVMWFNGGVFAAKREMLYKNFNFKLFDLFEERIGMGEDAILGFGLAQEGNIVYLAEGMFLHDDQKDSTYTVDFTSYGRRVIYSRLYLSLEYVRLLNKSKMIAILHYQWYVLWRILGLVLNQFLSYKDSRKQLIKGYVQGWNKARKDCQVLRENSQEYWIKEAGNDLLS